MDDVIPYYKPLGLTPLQTIAKLKAERPELATAPITYAGRLDPMAEGLLLLLKGGELKQKEKYLNLPKTYEAKILFGFSSDTFDILGLPYYHGNAMLPTEKEIEQTLPSLTGEHHFPYPPYSSQPVQGKPLWQWAKENRLSEITIPNRNMIVYSTALHKITPITWSTIYSYIYDSIQLVNGDFRQIEIIKTWTHYNDTINSDSLFTIPTITFSVSSGTYIRTLTQELGQKVNSGALLYHLKRTAIGPYHL